MTFELLLGTDPTGERWQLKDGADPRTVVASLTAGAGPHWAQVDVVIDGKPAVLNVNRALITGVSVFEERTAHASTYRPKGAPR
jgi:hypothetical protein